MLEQDDAPRILIVETNREFAQMMENRISRRFPSPVINVATSAANALDTASQQSFDIAVIDLNHTDFDGVSLVKSLCQLNDDLGVIVVANELTDQMVRDLFRHGCDELLIKDSTFYNVIPHLIKGLCQRKSVHKNPAAANRPPGSSGNGRPSSDLMSQLSAQIDDPLTSILAATADLLESSAVKQQGFRDRMKSIEMSAQKIRRFVRTYSSRRARIGTGDRVEADKNSQF